MSEALPIWTCNFEKPQNPPTVGATFSVTCQGDIPVAWHEGPLQVTFDKKENAYSLFVLNADKLESNQVVLTVTGYKAGDHHPEFIRFNQGQAGFEVAKPTWKIQSVLKQGEQVQPYPSFGPWSLGFPMWIIIAFAVLLMVIGFFVFRQVRRYSQRKRMREELRLHRTALTPINQFYRDARQLRRGLNVAQDEAAIKTIATGLNKEFRLYILREFEIPTLEWSDRAILEDLRRRHKHVYGHAAEPLKKTLRELARLQTQSSPGAKDVEQLHRMSLDAAERIEAAKDLRKGRR